MTKKIIWLASYPKSGNTWLKIFLEILIKGSSEPVDINKLSLVGHAAGRDLLDNFLDIETSDLSEEEVELYRPEIYETIAATTKNKDILFYKVHDAFIYNKSQKPIFPTKATLGTVYIMRNPLDIAVSFAHHEAKNVDYIISKMANQYATMYDFQDKIIDQTRQKLLTWSQHVKSWVDIKIFPVHIVRYEDMMINTVQTFEKVVKFVNLHYGKNQIEKAIEYSSFELLQYQEKKHGFREKNIKADSFFRKGEIGSWKECLSVQQIKRIIENHKEIMVRYGYLTTDGQIIY